MANHQHVALVRLGSVEFSEWREEHPQEQVDLEEADLKGMKLRGVNLDGANLKKANLEGAILSKSTLRRADLWGANLECAGLLHVDLSHANVSRANLKGAKLGSSTLRDTWLLDSNLSGADLAGSDLAGAHLDGTTGLNLIGTRNYVVDGLDTSTWVIPPAWLWPRIFWPEDPRIEHIPRWQLWRLRVWSPYSDPWSAVRRSYTGVMTAFHLVLATVALGPYALRAVLAEAGDFGIPRIAVALGWGREGAWFLISSGIVLVTYNALRIVATWWLSQLREEELRSRHAPPKNQYWAFWLLHKWFLRWAGYLAVSLSVWRTSWWLCERV